MQKNMTLTLVYIDCIIIWTFQNYQKRPWRILKAKVILLATLKNPDVFKINPDSSEWNKVTTLHVKGSQVKFTSGH